MLTWGGGECGKLGLADDLSDRLVPTQVRGALLNKAVVQVAAGDKHSMCVNGDGSVYSWGFNYDGQLGVADAGDAAHLPMLVQPLDVNSQ